MKLPFAQFTSHLTQTLSAIYLISGDELVLKNEALSLLRKTAKQAGFSERVRLVPATGSDMSELYTTLYSNSLLTEKRIVELDLRDTSLPKTAADILQAYGKNPHPDTVLILDMGKVDNKVAKSAWYQSLDKAGVSVAIWPISREQLPAWIRERTKKYKMTLAADAARVLAEYVEGNLAAAAQALEKIYLLNEKAPIDAALIKTMLTNENHFTVFDLIENLIAGETSRTLAILENLRMEGIEPVLILWGITRELRLLADFAKQTEQGVTLSALFQQQRIFANRQTAIRRFLTQHSAKECWQLLLRTAEMDSIIKGAVSGNIWESLQLFCLRIA